MRRAPWALFVLALLAATACRPSAVMRQATPVGNLQFYRALSVQVNAATPAAQGLVPSLEYNAATRLEQQCAFESVSPMSQGVGAQADLVLNLNIQRSFRGGEGVIQNPNQAVVDVLAVLSDATNDELVGSVWIRGKSPAVAIGGLAPENQAVDAVAQQVVAMMRNSGCELERVARPVTEDPEPPLAPIDPEDPDIAGDPAKKAQAEARAQAEALNDEGKSMFRTGNLDGAAGKFREAITTSPDPRYYFNLCFAYEQLKRWDDALAACREVLDGGANERLVDKANQRIQSIELKRSSPSEA